VILGKETTMHDTREYLTPEEAAEVLHLNVQTVRKYIRQGQLKASKTGRHYKIHTEWIHEFVNNNLAA